MKAGQEQSEWSGGASAFVSMEHRGGVRVSSGLSFEVVVSFDVVCVG